MVQEPATPILCDSIEEDLVVVIPSLKPARLICLSSQPFLPRSITLRDPSIPTSLCEEISKEALATHWFAKVREWWRERNFRVCSLLRRGWPARLSTQLPAT
eukprot:m.323054 g.323054  ORF g.323054 m.323054 type:complete len:102 (-) comp55520_c0_seq1:1593-1898(-)